MNKWCKQEVAPMCQGMHLVSANEALCNSVVWFASGVCGIKLLSSLHVRRVCRATRVCLARLLQAESPLLLGRDQCLEAGEGISRNPTYGQGYPTPALGAAANAPRQPRSAPSSRLQEVKRTAPSATARCDFWWWGTPPRGCSTFWRSPWRPPWVWTFSWGVRVVSLEPLERSGRSDSAPKS